MKHARALLTLAGCAMLIAVPALAQDAPSFEAPFTVERGADGCSVSSAPGNPTGVAVSVGDTLDGRLRLRASGADWRFEPGKIYRIRAYASSDSKRPDGPGTEARGFRDAAGWGGFSVESDFRALYSAASVVLYDGSAAMPFAEIPNPYPGHILALSQCIAALLRADQESGKRGAADPRPRGLLGNFFTDDDYPAAALRAESSGVTRFLLTISADGRVSDCTVTQSSGSALLDHNSCSLAERRARFLPARDSAGAATEGSFDMALHWEITGEFRGRVHATR